MKSSLRESTISYFRDNQFFADKELVLEFLRYLEAYCAELNHTEWDVLLNDDHYEQVFHLFDNIILQNKPELTF